MSGGVSLRCETCGAIEPRHCLFGALEVGCDHPRIQRECQEAFDDLMSGKLIADHQAYFAKWLRDWERRSALSPKGSSG